MPYHTVYLVAQYLPWMGILRREVQFLGTDRSGQSKKFWELDMSVSRSFSMHSGWGTNFMVRNGEQDAIGDVMIDHDISNGNQKICLSYPNFLLKYHDDHSKGNFRTWFKSLVGDFDELLAQKHPKDPRLTAVHDNLATLIKELDTDKILRPDGPNSVLIEHHRQVRPAGTRLSHV
jgi:predicted transcriptional regulator YheO